MPREGEQNVAGSDVALTPAQLAALEVLAGAAKPVRGGKRRSQTEPVRHVNTAAALNLSRQGLVRLHLHNRGPFSSGYDFTITEAGRERLTHG